MLGAFVGEAIVFVIFAPMCVLTLHPGLDDCSCVGKFLGLYSVLLVYMSVVQVPYFSYYGFMI